MRFFFPDSGSTPGSAFAPERAFTYASPEDAVLPVFFEGQNSRLFQWASRLSMTLCLALLFHEVVNKMGCELRLRIGMPLAPHQLTHIADRRALADHLRQLTYAPQPEAPAAFAEPFEPPLGPVFRLL